jgi:hypothetical protein
MQNNEKKLDQRIKSLRPQAANGFSGLCTNNEIPHHHVDDVIPEESFYNSRPFLEKEKDSSGMTFHFAFASTGNLLNIRWPLLSVGPFCFFFNLLSCIALFTATNAHAQLFPSLGGQRAGTAAAQFLKIGVGARSAAMGEAFAAVANDGSALFWNPAGLMQSDKNEALFSHLEWLVDVQHEFFGYVHHFGKQQAIGISFVALHTAEMQETTEYQPFGTGRYFSFSDIAAVDVYAR